MYRVHVDGEGGRGTTGDKRFLTALRRDTQVEAADYALLYRIPETAPGALTTAADEGLALRPSTPSVARETPTLPPNDPKYRYQWHLDQIHMPEAWSKNQGDGVIVAVLDTGVTPVEDLRNRAGRGLELRRQQRRYPRRSRPRNARRRHHRPDHAQRARRRGVAYRAKIMPIKVLSGSGSGSVGGIAEGIQTTDHGARVINTSLGGPFIRRSWPAPCATPPITASWWSAPPATMGGQGQLSRRQQRGHRRRRDPVRRDHDLLFQLG